MFELNIFVDEHGYQAAVFAPQHGRAEEIWEAIAERFRLMPEGWLGWERGERGLPLPSPYP